MQKRLQQRKHLYKHNFSKPPGLKAHCDFLAHDLRNVTFPVSSYKEIIPAHLTSYALRLFIKFASDVVIFVPRIV